MRLSPGQLVKISLGSSRTSSFIALHRGCRIRPSASRAIVQYVFSFIVQIRGRFLPNDTASRSTRYSGATRNAQGRNST